MKISRHKRKFENGIGKVSLKTNEIDTNLKSIYSMVIKLNKKIDPESLGDNNENEGNMPNMILPIENTNGQVNFSTNNVQIEEMRDDIKDKLDQLKYHNKIQDEDLNKIKKYLSNLNTNNISPLNDVVLDFKDTNVISKEEFEEVKETINNLVKGEGYILDQLNFKAGKDDLEKSQKALVLEIDKQVKLPKLESKI